MCGTILTGAAVGVLVGVNIYKEWIPDDIYLPVFSITAEEIFANEIHLFDINFFNPKPTKQIVKTEEKVVATLYESYDAFIKVFVSLGGEKVIDGNGGWIDDDHRDGITVNNTQYTQIYSNEEIEDWRSYEELGEAVFNKTYALMDKNGCPTIDVICESLTAR